jgi:hypothetical protein
MLALQDSLARTASTARYCGIITIQGLSQIERQSTLSYMPRTYYKIGMGYGIRFDTAIQQRCNSILSYNLPHVKSNPDKFPGAQKEGGPARDSLPVLILIW